MKIPHIFDEDIERIRELRNEVSDSKNIFKDKVSSVLKSSIKNKKVLSKQERKEVSLKILNDNKYEIIDVSITMTMIERTTIMSGYCEQIYSNLWTKCKFNPLMFQSEIVGALIYIDYFKAYSTYFGSERDAKLLKLMGEDNMNVYDDYKMDLISVFIYYYGRTMKGMNK